MSITKYLLLFSGPTPGYFNDDAIPDLLITYMIGPSFPTFYYSEVTSFTSNLGNYFMFEDVCCFIFLCRHGSVMEKWEKIW